MKFQQTSSQISIWRHRLSFQQRGLFVCSGQAVPLCRIKPVSADMGAATVQVFQQFRVTVGHGQSRPLEGTWKAECLYQPWKQDVFGNLSEAGKLSLRWKRASRKLKRSGCCCRYIPWEKLLISLTDKASKKQSRMIFAQWCLQILCF